MCIPHSRAAFTSHISKKGRDLVWPWFYCLISYYIHPALSLSLSCMYIISILYCCLYSFNFTQPSLSHAKYVRLSVILYLMKASFSSHTIQQNDRDSFFLSHSPHSRLHSLHSFFFFYIFLQLLSRQLQRSIYCQKVKLMVSRWTTRKSSVFIKVCVWVYLCSCRISKANLCLICSISISAFVQFTLKFTYFLFFPWTMSLIGPFQTSTLVHGKLHFCFSSAATLFISFFHVFLNPIQKHLPCLYFPFPQNLLSLSLLSSRVSVSSVSPHKGGLSNQVSSWLLPSISSLSFLNYSFCGVTNHSTAAYTSLGETT